MDSNWLGTAVGVVITLFVFLLGVPALIFQTFVPSHLRKLFNERIGRNHLQSFINFGLFLLIFIVCFGNHGIYYIIQYFSPDHTEVYVNIWYLISLLALIIFVLFSIRSFLKQLNYFSDSGGTNEKIFNPYQDIVYEIVKSFQEYFQVNNSISNRDKTDLFFISRSYERGIHKRYFIDGCKQIMDLVVKNNYEGKEFKEMEFFKILNNSFDSREGMNHENMLHVLEIFNVINNCFFKNLELSKNDRDIEDNMSIQDMLISTYSCIELGNLGLEKGYDKVVRKAFSIVDQNVSKANSFKLGVSDYFKVTYAKKIQNIEEKSIEEIYNLSQAIISSKRFNLYSIVLQKLRKEYFQNYKMEYVISLTASLSIANEITQEIAIKHFHTLQLSQPKEELEKADFFFRLKADYQAIQNIRVFRSKLFPPQHRDFEHYWEW